MGRQAGSDDQGRSEARKEVRERRRNEDRLLRLYLSGQFNPTTDRPYAIVDHLKADRDGVSVWAWVTCSLDVVAIARKYLLLTLLENGIDPSVVQWDPIATTTDNGQFVNQNPSGGKHPKGKKLLGFCEKLRFPYKAINCREWFINGRTGEVDTVLGLVSLED